MAIGSVTNDFGTPGAAEFAVPLETPEQASRFNRRLVNACLRANTQNEPGAARPVACRDHRRRRDRHRTGRRTAPHRARGHRLWHGPDRSRKGHQDRPDRGGRPHPARAAAAHFRGDAGAADKIGVEVRTGARVAEVRADGVRARRGEIIPSELVVWSAGVKAPEFLEESTGWRPTASISSSSADVADHARSRHFRDRRLRGLPASRRSPAACRRARRPPTRWPTHMVRRSSTACAGEPLEPFVYRDFGSLVSLGKYSTVGSLMGFIVGRSMFIEGLFRAADVPLALQDARSRAARRTDGAVAHDRQHDLATPDTECEAALRGPLSRGGPPSVRRR